MFLIQRPFAHLTAKKREIHANLISKVGPWRKSFPKMRDPAKPHYNKIISSQHSKANSPRFFRND